MFTNLFATRGLSLDRLKTLIEVAEAGSIAAAAVGDAARQSLYSRQLKELEEFFGVELTVRKGRVLSLTKEGWELARIARENLNQLNDFKERNNDKPYRFSIGAGDSFHAWLVAPMLAEMQRGDMKYLFELKSCRNSEVAGKLLNMDIDFGIVRESGLTEGLQHRYICDMDYVLFVSRKKYEKLKVPQGEKALPYLLETLPLATLGDTTSFYRQLEKQCREYNIPFQNHCETQSFPIAERLLKTGAYTAILPSVAARSLGADYVAISHPILKKLSRRIMLAWNPRLLRIRPMAKHIIDLSWGDLV